MKRPGLSMMALGLALAGFNAAADVPPSLPLPARPAVSSESASMIPQVVIPPSPVAMFRRLLAMNTREREMYLASRPPEKRLALRAKIQEYLALDPDARELQLRQTELRWQLIPLFNLAPDARASRLAMVPDDLAPLVKNRLAEWDQLSPDLQKEFLANDRALNYFAHVGTTNQVGADGDGEVERQKITGQFNQFFELTPEEKQSTLKTLSSTERAQMEQTLQAYGKLSATQRRQCLHAFAKFAELSPAERAEFLKNAERWAQMSPQERQTWRDLVVRVPSWPPMPPGFNTPPLPPLPVKKHADMATN